MCPTRILLHPKVNSLFSKVLVPYFRPVPTYKVMTFQSVPCEHMLILWRLTQFLMKTGEEVRNPRSLRTCLSFVSLDNMNSPVFTKPKLFQTWIALSIGEITIPG